MGSGNDNRKISDVVMIRRPKGIAEIGITGIGFTHNEVKEPADICKPSFEVKLKSFAGVQEGINLYLKQEGNKYNVVLGNNSVVATVQSKLSMMIEECSTLGIDYRGKAIKIKNIFYARFIREI